MIGNFIGVLFDGIAYGSLLFVISIGLSVTILTGIPAAIMLWRSAHHLDADRRDLAA